MYYEFRAYCVSLYVEYKLSKILKCKFDIYNIKNKYLENFINSNYYYMFPFKDYLFYKFENVIDKILQDKLPYEEDITKNIEKILNDLSNK